VNKVALLVAAALGLLALASAAVAAGSAVARECPDGYQVHEGLNVGFPHNGMKRSFWVYPPADGTNPAPVWVPLTGTVESTNDNLTAPHSGANALMARQGFMVIGAGPPIGLCADYRPATQASSNFLAAQPNVVHVACSPIYGRMWPQTDTQAFNAWARVKDACCAIKRAEFDVQ
jgi:poly(3-hydroxybutyrate) depolymerase